MRGFKVLAAFAAMLGVSPAVMATVPLPYGWYVEGNIGASRANNVSYASGTSTSAQGNSAGWNLDLGYKFIPFFGIEVGYTNYSNQNAEFGSAKVASASMYSYDIAGKAMLPFGDSGFEVFGKLGASRVHSHVKVSNSAVVNANGIVVNTGTHAATGLYFGLGADYAFMPNLTGSLQWNRARGNNSTGDLDLYSVGLTYIFDW